MAANYAHLGPFSDLVEVAARFAMPARAGRPGPDTAAVRRLLGFDHDASPVDPRTEARWSRDGVDGEEVSWSVGYGPRTRAWYLRPSGVAGALPGVLGAAAGHRRR